MIGLKHTVFGIYLTQVAYASNTRGWSQSSSMSSSSSPVTSFAALSANRDDPDLTIVMGVGVKPLTPIKNDKDKNKYVWNIMILIKRNCNNRLWYDTQYATSNHFTAVSRYYE
jgi:hypothetical protein